MIRALALAPLFAGCGTDLGECSDEWARTVVYQNGLTPHYEGQALVQTHCAGSFCHTASATGALRFGVPADLDFDVPSIMATDTGDAKRTRLARGLANVREWAEEMWDLVDSGTMPPGEAGTRSPELWLHPFPDGTIPTGRPNELFSVRSARGKDILRNWLACGAPVVAGSEEACNLTPELRSIGDCKPADRGAPAGEYIYMAIIEGQGCTACHSPGQPFFTDHMLDLTRDDDGIGASEAYAAVVDAPARGPQCRGTDETTGQPLKLIVRGNCQASIFYQKLAANGPGEVCGQPMPLGRAPDPFPRELLDQLCDWINAGAPMTGAAPPTPAP